MAGKIKQFPVQKLSEAERKQLTDYLAEQFGITATRFDEASGEPILGYEDTQTLVNALCADIAEDRAEIIFRDDAEARCGATITLRDGRRYDRTGFCLLNESLGDGECVNTPQQAVAIAMGRAYRAVLRAINFNPIRAVRQQMAGAPVEPPTPELSGDEANLRKRLHALAAEAGYVNGDDRSKYRTLLMAMYGVNTSVNLDAAQISNLCGFLQAEIKRNKWREREAA